MTTTTTKTRTEKQIYEAALQRWAGAGTFILTVYRHLTKSHRPKSAKFHTKALSKKILAGISTQQPKRLALLTYLRELVEERKAYRTQSYRVAIIALDRLDAMHRANSLKGIKPVPDAQPTTLVACPSQEAVAASKTTHSIMAVFETSLANRSAMVLAAIFSANPKTTAAEVKELLDHNPSLGSLTLADVLLRPAFPVARPAAG